MEQNNPGQLTQRKPGVIVISASTVAFLALCAYLALVFLNYMEEIPEGLDSLVLYGFVVLMVLAIAAVGRMILETHMIWYGVFTLVCLISCAYAAYPQTSISKTIEVAKVLVFSVMFLNAVQSKKRLKTTIFIIMISSFVWFLYLAANGLLDMEERLGGELTGNANAFAAIFMIGAVSSVYYIFFSEKPAHKFLAFVCFIMQMYALALSGSRKYFLLPVVLLGAVKMFSTDKTGRKHLARNTLIGLVVILGMWWAMFNVEFLYDTVGYRMEGMVAGFTGEGEVDASTKIRLNMIDIAIRLWKEKPLLGHGLNNYKYLNNLYFNAYAHNNYAELLATLGLVGLVAYYWYYVYLVKKLIAAKSMGVERWYWAIVIIALAVFDYGAVSYDMYPVHFVLLQASVALRLHNEATKDEKQEDLNNEQNTDACSPA